MKYVTSSEIERIAEDILSAEVVLIGELHGIKQNIHILQLITELILRKRRSVVLAFEWPLTEQEVKEINEYIASRSDKFPQSPFFIDSDGRFTKEHILLFNHVRKNYRLSDVSIQCFDSFNFSENYERKMADKLLELKLAGNAILVAETGVIHARKKRYEDAEVEVREPMGFYLAERSKTLSIFLRYLSGTVLVEGIIHPVTEAASQIEGPGDLFDIELAISDAEPASVIGELTEIHALLES